MNTKAPITTAWTDVTGRKGWLVYYVDGLIKFVERPSIDHGLVIPVKTYKRLSWIINGNTP